MTTTDGGVRRQKVRAAAKAWTDQLVDVTGRNSLLFYKDLKQGTLDVGPVSGAATATVDALLAGTSVRLSALFPDETARAANAKRARTIRAKAQENFEERGLRTLFLARGMATWINPRGEAIPAAPVLLRPATFTPRGGAHEDFELELGDDWEVNPTLLHVLANDHQVVLDGDDLLDVLDAEPPNAGGPAALFQQLTTAAGAIAGFAVTDRIVFGNFSYAKLPMVHDIEAAAASGLLEADELLAAIAGDEDARAVLRAAFHDVALDAPDHTDPRDEFLVLDADASQTSVVNATLAGSTLVVEGPPGTGKSQTIANLIAALAARGQRVLFVAEKRAAIDAVVDRLGRVGLGDLVLDLHDGVGSKRQLAQDLAKAMADHASVVVPDVSDVHRTLTLRRDTLRDRNQALHELREPWGVSVFDVQARLLALPQAAVTDLRLRGDVLNALDATAYPMAREELREYVELGGPALGAGTGSPWAGALVKETITTADAARAALDATAHLAQQTLPASRAKLDATVAEVGLPHPTTVAGWHDTIELLKGVAATLERFEPAVYENPVTELASALAPGAKGFFGRLFAGWFNGSYKKARATLAPLWRKGKPKPKELHAATVAAAAQRKAWATPKLPADLAGADAAHMQLAIEWRAVEAAVGATGWGALSDDALAQQLAQLLADQTTLYRLPDLHRLRTSLQTRGLLELGTHATPLDALDHAWLTSIMETVSLADPRVGAFDGAALHRTVDEFVTADHSHITSTVQRVRRAVAEHAVATRDKFPAESDIIEKQARLKRRHLPVRQLFQAAPNVLGAMKPCWAMSPLVVAQLLPAAKHFDVVVFDEASQVTPADAVGALLRAASAVVAGDTKQLPPTAFFTATLEDDETPGDATDDDLALTHGLESVLDVMGALLPAPHGTRTLAWHYRSRDERLIAFSNAQPSLYDWALTTFPGVAGEQCLGYVLVPWQAGRVDQEESVSDEVDRVVALILEHARTRPDESLGVIAMGIKHSERVSEALRKARANASELDQFFDAGPASRGGREPVFVKNLERVQGDERDAIILSVGYGKNVDGKMVYRFGPINQEGGERRLNVAITRARNRMTVVSSFAAADLDPARLNAEGARMLGRYLAYVESHGTNLGEVAREKPPLDGFERDVRDRLTAAGIPVVAQHGSSGQWIDFAASHPTDPTRMVLAIECDGATYRASATARDRERLRREHLQRLGWSFHRIWSTDWFRNRDAEIARAKAAYDAAVAKVDAAPVVTATAPAASAPAATAPVDTRREPKPRFISSAGVPIDEYSHEQLVRVIQWIESDTLLRTEEELLEDAMQELGYERRGPRILAALTAAIVDARKRA
jgi:hypothetical protein